MRKRGEEEGVECGKDKVTATATSKELDWYLVSKWNAVCWYLWSGKTLHVVSFVFCVMLFRWRRYCWWCRLCFCCATLQVTSSVSTYSLCRSSIPTTLPDIRSSLPRTSSSISSTSTSLPTFSCTTRLAGRSATPWCAVLEAVFDEWQPATASGIVAHSTTPSPVKLLPAAPRSPEIAQILRSIYRW